MLLGLYLFCFLLSLLLALLFWCFAVIEAGPEFLAVFVPGHEAGEGFGCVIGGGRFVVFCFTTTGFLAFGWACCEEVFCWFDYGEWFCARRWWEVIVGFVVFGVALAFVFCWHFGRSGGGEDCV